MVMKTGPSGAFNSKEKKAFAPGGSLSTPKQRKDVPADHFLLPKERKYPYKANGQISCNLLKAAISRAGQNGEAAVESRAKKLYADNCESD